MVKIMHARFSVAGIVVIAYGAPPDHSKSQGLAVSLSVDKPAQCRPNIRGSEGERRVSNATTFWAKRFSSVTNRFGVPWMINWEQPA